MLYLSRFTFPSQERESLFFHGPQRQCYNTYYPFGVITRFDPTEIEFEPITILYGGNGTGKSTALNVIAEKLQLQRDARYNRSSFFEGYVGLCDAEIRREIPRHSRIITSDDVFDYMLNLRALNEGIDERREEIFREYTTACELTRVKSTNMGSMFRLTFDVILRDPSKEKELIDKLRERNGNLEITVSKQETTEAQL
jgi:Cdc6-like AAA superfamily ATPase